MPELQQLHMGFNELKSIERPDGCDPNAPITGFDNLTLLNLEGNSLSQWSNLQLFSHLKRYVFCPLYAL